MDLSRTSDFALGFTKVNFKVNTSGTRSSFSFKTEGDKENYNRPVCGSRSLKKLSLHLLFPLQRIQYIMRTSLQLTVAARKANSTPTVWTGAWYREGIVLLYSVPARQPLNTGSSFGLLWYWKDTHQEEWSQWGTLALWEAAEALGLVQPGEGKSFGENTPEHPACTPQWEGLREDRVRVSLSCMMGAWQNR